MSVILWASLLLAPGPSNSPPATGPRRPASHTVAGTLRSAGERTPIANAKIFATPRRGTAWTREATTGDDGSFLLADLPTRDFTLTIVAAGHERLVQPTTSAYWTARRPPIIYLQPTGTGRYRTIVAAARDQHPSPVSTRLAPEEVATLAGSQGDPLRALQNLPGMARVPGGLGLLVMRGATPNQSQVFFGEHPIPRAFHFPGLASVVPGAALGGITYTPGNFDSSYGNAVGGIVTLTPRVGRRDRIRGMAKFDVASAGASIEGPLRKGSFLIAAQRGYLDLALRALAPLGVNFVLPRYYDYQVVFTHPIGRGASVTTRFIGASDSLRYPGTGNKFELRSEFHRFDLTLRKRVGGWDFMVAPAVRLDSSGLYTGQNYSNRRGDTVGLLRAEITARPSRRFTLTVGADTQLDRYRTYSAHINYNDPLTPLVLTEGEGLSTNSGLYVTPVLALGRFTISPGVRVSAFTGKVGQAFSVDPRLVVRWAPHPRVAVMAGAGQYSQPNQRTIQAGSSGLLDVYTSKGSALVPGGLDGSVAVLPGAVRYLDPGLAFDPTGALGVSQALHLSGGFHLELVRSLGLDATAFYRRVRDGIPPERFGTDTGSITYGVEALLRKELSRRLYGWVAYTWMRSEQGEIADGKLTRRAPADFDQRHNLVLAANVKLPRRWEIGGRFRVVTGLPYTPVLGGIYSADQPPLYDAGPLSQPLFGELNHARMATFHQLDLRIDRTWVLRRSIVNAYFDVQNVYNRQNPEGLIYNPHFTAVKAAVGVPILPVVGVRVEF